MSHAAIIVTRGDPRTLNALLNACRELVDGGQEVRVFVRDEATPALCAPAVAKRLGWPENVGGDQDVADSVRTTLARLTGDGRVKVYACTSSLYVWGLSSQDLLPSVTGGRGLIAFLADDLAEATEVRCF